jgi:TPR repeat protein
VWYQRGAEAGHVDAMINIANLLKEAQPPDLERARVWWESAAARGDAAAMGALGYLYAKLVQPADLTLARHWYRRAADAGDYCAAFHLGALAAQSEPPDLDSARQWLERAAEAGHAAAMTYLADIYADMDPPDDGMRRHWLQRAAEAGVPEAMYLLGSMSVDVRDQDAVDVAIGWFERASESGHTASMFALGTVCEQLVEPPDLDAARQWWRRAADGGHTAAAKRLAALTAPWTTPDGWGEVPPGQAQIRAMADWLDRYGEAVDDVLDAIESAMEEQLEAVPSRQPAALLTWCHRVGSLIADGLAAIGPTPDQDLTEALRALIHTGEEFRSEVQALPHRPTIQELQPFQASIADIAPSLERFAAVYSRDCEIVEAAGF